ncbi:SDR family NAD(P)-dependent oxidoreductase [Bacteroidota bacterium]
MHAENKQSKYKSPVAAIFTGIGDLFKKPKDQLILNESDRLDGKKVLITGASSGLGFATAIDLAKRGAHVIMAVRSGIPGKGEEVKKKSASQKVDMIPLDLSDLTSLPKLAAEVKERFGPVDIVISNAAMVAARSREIYGLDEMFVVNYFAKFIFINALLEQGAINTRGATLPRIIFVASESHRNPEQFEWDKFGKFESYGTGKSVAIYGYYKLLLVTLAKHFSRRLNPDDGINYAIHSLCPGPVNSNIARETPKIFQPLLKLVFSIFFRSPAKACKPVVYLAASPEIEARTGNYLFLMQDKEVDEKADDPQNGKRLWEMTEELQQKLKL